MKKCFNNKYGKCLIDTNWQMLLYTSCDTKCVWKISDLWILFYCQFTNFQIIFAYVMDHSSWWFMKARTLIGTHEFWWENFKLNQKKRWKSDWPNDSEPTRNENIVTSLI